MRQLLELTGIAVENLVHRTRLGLRETARLGRHRWYWRLRSALARQAILGPPHQVARWEGAATGLSADDLTYGETPILTAWEMLTAVPAQKVVDLGCGRGLVVLTARLALGCSGVGIEALPGLARRCAGAARSLGVAADCQFEARDFRSGPLPPADLYFVSPTTLEEDSFQALCHLMEQAPPGALAYSLSVELPGWETLETRLRPYSWGWATTYLQRR